jgi:hypothetical protein
METEDREDEETGEEVTALVATFERYQPDFMNAVKAGLWENRSLSVNDDLTVNHVAWLGAALPAVPKLKPLDLNQFSASRPAGVEAHTIMATNTNQKTKTPARARNHAEGDAATGGATAGAADEATPAGEDAVVEKLDEVLSAVTSLATMIEKFVAAQGGDTSETSGGAGADAAGGGAGSTFSKKTPAAAAGTSKADKDEIERLKAENQKFRFSAILDAPDLITRVTPALRPQVEQMMATLDKTAGKFSFAKADGTTVEHTALENYIETLKQLPEQWTPGEIARKDHAGATQKGAAVVGANDVFQKAADEIVAASKASKRK